MAAARAAPADAGPDWREAGSIVGADTVRGGCPGYAAGATFARAPGWRGARISSVYATCASGAQAIDTARAPILAGLADVVLVAGADAAPEGFFRPAGTGPTARTGCGSASSAPPTPPGSGRTPGGAGRARRHVGGLGTGQGEERGHGRAQPEHALPQAGHRAGGRRPAVVADPLRLLDICATSDGGTALVGTGPEFARRRGVTDPVRIRAVPTVTPRCPDTVLDLPDMATDSAAAARPGHLPEVHRAGRVRAGGPRSRGPVAGRGPRPVDRSGAAVVRGPGAGRPGRGGHVAADRGDGGRRAHAREHERRSGFLRRGGPGAGRHPGVRADLAAEGRGRCSAGGRGAGRHQREPGAVRPRFGGGRRALSGVGRRKGIAASRVGPVGVRTHRALPACVHCRCPQPRDRTGRVPRSHRTCPTTAPDVSCGFRATVRCHGRTGGTPRRSFPGRRHRLTDGREGTLQSIRSASLTPSGRRGTLPVSVDIAVHLGGFPARRCWGPRASRPTPHGRFGCDGTLVTVAGRGAGSPCLRPT